MNPKRLQLISLICLVLSLLVELADQQAWLDFGNPELPWGISLGLVLAALSFNIKVIRDFGVAKKVRKQSQGLVMLTAVYAFAVFALEII